MERTADLNDIKKAYYKLAKKYHPDNNAEDPIKEERFKEATEAYHVLIDPVQRAEYDRAQDAQNAEKKYGEDVKDSYTRKGYTQSSQSSNRSSNQSSNPSSDHSAHAMHASLLKRFKLHFICICVIALIVIIAILYSDHKNDKWKIKFNTHNVTLHVGESIFITCSSENGQIHIIYPSEADKDCFSCELVSTERVEDGYYYSLQLTGRKPTDAFSGGYASLNAVPTDLENLIHDNTYILQPYWDQVHVTVVP